LREEQAKSDFRLQIAEPSIIRMIFNLQSQIENLQSRAGIDAGNLTETGAIMEVILKEDVAKLGSRGDVVKVAEGYGRNFLLPRKLAIEANEGNKAVITQMKAAAVRRSAKEKAQAEELAKQFDGVSVSFTRKSGEHDQLFGSVTSSDLADGLAKKGFNLDRRKIQLHEPLKTLGEFTVPVKLHKDVTAHLKVVIEKEAVTE
jgi:large subunit ribosomal protein L9